MSTSSSVDKASSDAVPHPVLPVFWPTLRSTLLTFTPLNQDCVSLLQPFLGDAHLIVLDSTRICVISLLERHVWTLAGSETSGHVDGQGAAAQLQDLQCLALDPADGSFLVGEFKGCIRRVTRDGIVTSVAGKSGVQGYQEGVGEAAHFKAIGALAVLGNHLYVSDTYNCCIRRFPLDFLSFSELVAGYPGRKACQDGDGENARFGCVLGMCARPQNNSLLVVDCYRSVLREVSLPSFAVRTIDGEAEDEYDEHGTPIFPCDPYDVVVESKDTVLVLGNHDPCVVRVNLSDFSKTTIAGHTKRRGHVDGFAGVAKMIDPMKLILDGEGGMFVSCENGTIRQIWEDGEMTTLVGEAWESKHVDGNMMDARFVAPSGMLLL